MPKPLPKRRPSAPAACAHKWIETTANGMVVHRLCRHCRAEQGVRQAPAAAGAASMPAPPKANDPSLMTPLEMAVMYQTALETLVSGNVSSYTLPTGVTVTRQGLAGVEASLRYWRKEALRQANGMKTVANMGLVWP